MRHPIPDYLASLITELGAVNPGETAQYIPVLAEADPDRFGIALATETGISGAVFYVAHHITIQTALFLVVGLVERRAGSTSLLRLGGLARLSPVLGVLFFLCLLYTSPSPRD